MGTCTVHLGFGLQILFTQLLYHHQGLPGHTCFTYSLNFMDFFFFFFIVTVILFTTIIIIIFMIVFIVISLLLLY